MKTFFYFLLPLLCACASIQPDLQAARKQALKQAHLAKAWQPDGQLILSPKSMNELAKASIEQVPAFQASLLSGTVTPKLHLTSVKVRKPNKECASCTAFAVVLEGKTTIKTPISTTKLSTKVTGVIEASLEIDFTSSQINVTVQPQSLRKIDVEIEDTLLPLSEVNRAIRTYLQRDWLSRIPAIEVPPISDGGLPLIGARVLFVSRAVCVQWRTAAQHQGPLPPPELIKRGVLVQHSTTAIVDLAAAESFRKGPITHHLIAQPTDMAIEGDHFTLSFRLWKDKGRGWWRDYELRGRVLSKNNRISLTDVQVTKIAKSKGAFWADPLISIGHGFIISAMENALTTSMPATHSAKISAQTASISVNEITGRGGWIEVSGDIQVRIQK